MNKMEAPIAAPYEAVLQIIFFLDFIPFRTITVSFVYWSKLRIYYSFPRHNSIASGGQASSGLCKSFGELERRASLFSLSVS